MEQVSSVQLPLSHGRSRHDFAAAENTKEHRKYCNCGRYERPNGGLREEPDEMRHLKRLTSRSDKRQRFMLIDTTHHGFQILPQGHSGRLVEKKDTSTCSGYRHFKRRRRKKHARKLGVSYQPVGQGVVGTQHKFGKHAHFMQFLKKGSIPVDEGSSHA